MEQGKTCLIDSHIHLSHGAFDGHFPYLKWEGGAVAREENGDRERLIAEMQARGIRACVEPGVGPDSLERLLDLARRYPDFLFPAVGVHPTRTWKYELVVWKDGKPERISRRLLWRERAGIAACAEREGVAAIGETGLDFHRRRSRQTGEEPGLLEQHRLRQLLWFVWQLRLAHKRELPVILHIREAHRCALLVLRLFRNRLHGGVCHCFTGGPELARRYVALGLKLGIGASLLQEDPDGPLNRAVRETALEHLLLETDGPFVKPPCPGISQKQWKKARNTSLILPAVAERIAELKSVSTEEVLRITSANAGSLFGIPETASKETEE